MLGIVKTAKYICWDEPPRPFFYLPYTQNYASRMTLHVESAANVFGVVPRELPASDVRMLREYFDNGAMFGVKAALRIAALTGAGGLLLALAGLYGAVSSAVTRRRREIGIRIALGAGCGRVVAMILRQAMTIAVIGTAAGVVVAQWGSRFLPGAGKSPWASAGAAALMIAASLIDCAIPAMKACRADPALTMSDRQR